MPEICRFFHIIIRMYAKEHAPPHFHAFYGEHEALFSISTGKLIEGKFPPKQAKLIAAWAAIYKKELLANWKSLTSGKGFNKIDPLS
jgi:hypothetical protein